jgi:hypothetical protein
VIEKLKEEKSKYIQAFTTLLDERMLTCKTEIKTKEVCADSHCRTENLCGSTDNICKSKTVKKRVCEKNSNKKSCSIQNVERNNCPKGVSCESRKVCQQQCKKVFDKYDAKLKMEFALDSLEELDDEEVTFSFE